MKDSYFVFFFQGRTLKAQSLTFEWHINKPVSAFKGLVRSVSVSEGRWRAFSKLLSNHLTLWGLLPHSEEAYWWPGCSLKCRRDADSYEGKTRRYEQRDYSERQRWAGRRRQVMCNSETPTGEIANKTNSSSFISPVRHLWLYNSEFFRIIWIGREVFHECGCRALQQHITWWTKGDPLCDVEFCSPCAQLFVLAAVKSSS